MTPKEKRDLLFRGGRPNIRPMNIFDNSGYHRDVAICWLAHSQKPFYSIRSTEQAGFAAELLEQARMCEFLVAEDRNNHYESGTGPIGIVWVGTDGWKVEPHCVFFPWATARNKLRAVVSFLQMIRYRKIGACVIYCLHDSKALFEKAANYGVLHFSGKIHNGDPRGDEYIYSVRGKR